MNACVRLGAVATAGLLALGALESKPSLESAPVSTGTATLVGAGDIASCESTGDERTAALLDRFPEATVFTLGDHAYPNGTAEEFRECFDPSWGRHKHRTRPAPGNHDYRMDAAAAYFAYFGTSAGHPAQGYFSYDAGTWKVLVLNSNLPVHRGSDQERWLRRELVADQRPCTLAYMHHPRFSSGKYDDDTQHMLPIWEALYEGGTEIVIAGHEHFYE